MTTIQLTPAQHAILAYAIEHTGGKIEWLPDHIKGGARKKVLDGMSNRALITYDGTDWFVAAEGYDALACAGPTPVTIHPDPEVEAAVSAAEANWAQEKPEDVLPAVTSQTTIPADDREIEAAVAAAESSWRVDHLAKQEAANTRRRPNSKQATVLEMLRRPCGATIGEIQAVTGWQAHTVRGTFANVYKKQMGLTIASEKDQEGKRVYRIVEEALA